MPEPILDAQAIVRTYAGANGVLAVRGASLALEPKDFVALMGPSGSGKTTFIGVLSGLDRRTYPNIHRMRASYLGLAGDDAFRAGLHLILAGLQAERRGRARRLSRA